MQADRDRGFGIRECGLGRRRCSQNQSLVRRDAEMRRGEQLFLRLNTHRGQRVSHPRVLLRWQPKSPPPALRGIRFPPCATSPAAARVHGQATAPRKASARIRGHLKACSPTAHQQVGDRKPPRRTASFAEVHGLAQPVQMLRTPLFILMSTRIIRTKRGGGGPQ